MVLIDLPLKPLEGPATGRVAAGSCTLPLPLPLARRGASELALIPVCRVFVPVVLPLSGNPGLDVLLPLLMMFPSPCPPPKEGLLSLFIVAVPVRSAFRGILRKAGRGGNFISFAAEVLLEAAASPKALLLLLLLPLLLLLLLPNAVASVGVPKGKGDPGSERLEVGDVFLVLIFLRASNQRAAVDKQVR